VAPNLCSAPTSFKLFLFFLWRKIRIAGLAASCAGKQKQILPQRFRNPTPTVGKQQGDSRERKGSNKETTGRQQGDNRETEGDRGRQQGENRETKGTRKGNKMKTKGKQQGKNGNKGKKTEMKGKQQGDKGKQRGTKGKPKETKVNRRLKGSYLCSWLRKGGRPRWGPGCGPGGGEQNGSSVWQAGHSGRCVPCREATKGSAILGHLALEFGFLGPRKRNRFWVPIPRPKMVSPFSKS
jgi:hypothetical protein